MFEKVLLIVDLKPRHFDSLFLLVTPNIYFSLKEKLRSVVGIQFVAICIFCHSFLEHVCLKIPSSIFVWQEVKWNSYQDHNAETVVYNQDAHRKWKIQFQDAITFLFVKSKYKPNDIFGHKKCTLHWNHHDNKASLYDQSRNDCQFWETRFE